MNKVTATKGTKEVTSYMDGSDRDLVTVLACGNAAGVMLRPLILFDGVVHIGSASKAQTGGVISQQTGLELWMMPYFSIISN